MSLFIDNNVATEEMLLSRDSESKIVLEALAKGNSSSNVTLHGPMGILVQAWSDCRSRLEAALTSFSTFSGPCSTAHQMAVFNTGLSSNGIRPRVRLDQLVASDTYYSNSISPLQQWVLFAALRILFESAGLHFVGGNKAGNSADRYTEKAKRYQMEQNKIWNRLLSQGIPYVLVPFMAPAALHGWNSGTWDSDNVSEPSCFNADPSNTNANDQAIRIALTYVDNTSYISPVNKNNGESGPSMILEARIPANQLMTVDLTTLTPIAANNLPNVGISQGAVTYHIPTGINCYVGKARQNAPLFLQNSTPIPVSATGYQLPATLVTSGYALDNGQVPDPGSNLEFGPSRSRA